MFLTTGGESKHYGSLDRSVPVGILRVCLILQAKSSTPASLKWCVENIACYASTYIKVRYFALQKTDQANSSVIINLKRILHRLTKYATKFLFQFILHL